MLSENQRAQLSARLRAGRAVPAAPLGDPAAAGSTAGVIDLNGRGGVAAFAVHAASGSVFEYGPLAAELTGEVHLRGIEAAGLRPGGVPSSSLAEMADRYAGTVRAAQPTGPYRLIGWSMGGVLAFETARRLEAAADTVAQLVLVDAPARPVASYADTEQGLAALFAEQVAGGVGLPPDRPVAAHLDHLAERLGAGAHDRDEVRADVERRWAVFRAHAEALAGYQPGGEVTADAALVSAAGSPDSAGDWARVIRGRVRVLRTPADHYSCLRPPAVRSVADLIRTAWGPQVRSPDR